VVIPSVPQRNRLREAVPVVLASGRFTRQKDYPTLLRAFEVVRRTCNAKLVVLGDGPDREKIEQLIVELKLQDSVELVGYVSDTKEFYERSNVFVLSSRWEGFPNVLVEALAAGVPVVSTDGKGASREIVEPLLPENVVPVGDYTQLAERIVATLEAEVKSEVYQEYVRSRFDLPVIAKRYLEIDD
jgi:glycosyltransferase involved in cell wall biosynthesis